MAAATAAAAAAAAATAAAAAAVAAAVAAARGQARPPTSALSRFLKVLKARAPPTSRELAHRHWREGITTIIAANRFMHAGEALRRRRILEERRPARDAHHRRSSTVDWQPPESPARVLPYLYVGGREDAENLDALMALGITHVLNAAASLDEVHAEHFLYLKLELDDDDEEDIAGAFDAAISFIADAKEGGGTVLVHCVAGMSRSVALVLAWLLYAERMQLRAALDLVRQRRPIALPNPGFRLALARYEVQLAGGTSVADARSDPAWNFAPWNKESASYKRRRPNAGRRPLSELGGVVAGTLIDGSPGPEGTAAGGGSGGGGLLERRGSSAVLDGEEAAGGCCCTV